MAPNFESIQNLLIALEGLLLMRARSDIRGATSGGAHTASPQGQAGATPTTPNDMGRGLGDERGLIDALNLAITRGGDRSRLLWVVGIIQSYPPAERDRIITTLGGEKRKVVEKIPQPKGLDGKDRPPIERTTEENTLGTETLLNLSRMTEEEVRSILGILTTSKTDIALDRIKRIREALAEGSPFDTALRQTIVGIRQVGRSIPQPPYAELAEARLFTWISGWASRHPTLAVALVILILGGYAITRHLTNS